MVERYIYSNRLESLPMQVDMEQLSTKFSSTKRVKIVLILSFLGIFMFMIYHYGRTSSWDIEHTMIGYLTMKQGHLIDHSHVARTPGFYTFAAVLFSVSNISKASAVFYPLLLLPFSSILFVLLRRISRSATFAIVGVLIFILAGPDGRIALFRLHSIGYVLAYNILFLLLLSLSNNYSSADQMNKLIDKNRFFLSIAILGSGLVYISYNRTAEVMLVIGWMVVFMMIFQSTSRFDNVVSGYQTSIKRGLFTILLVMGAAIIWFHYFFTFFLPFFIQQIELDRISWFDIVLRVWLGRRRK